MKRKNTLRALLASVLALVLCCSMLVSTTFAWFTDRASTGVNTITAGNLDIGLKYSTDFETWVDAETATEIFAKDALWEPGYTEVVYFEVENKGDLAVNYRVGTNLVGNTPGKNKDGEAIDLTQYIKFGIVPVTAKFADRDAALAAVTDPVDFANLFTAEQSLDTKGAKATFAMVVFMPDSVTNAANHNGTDVPAVQFGVHVIASQKQYENDSFGNDYDAGAIYPYIAPDTSWDNETDTEFVLMDAADLFGFAQLVNAGDTFDGKTVKLGADIDLQNAAWDPIGYAVVADNKYDWAASPHFAGTFDGQGHTISNLYVNQPEVNIQGFFGYGKIKEVKNLTFNNASVAGLRRSAVLVGQNDGFMNVSNVTFTGDIKVEVAKNEAGTLAGRGGLGNVSNVTVNASADSYVKCTVINSDYWEYIGGVWGHAWPTKATDVSSNIDVYAYASTTGGIGGGCAVNSENVSCTGDVTLAIKDTAVHTGNYQCWQTNGTVYGFGVGSSNASTQSKCSATGILTIGGTKVDALGINNTGYNVNDNRFGAPYYESGVITIN